MTLLQPDKGLVEAFTAGTLDPEEETALAGQVARVLPAHWMLPNPAVSALSAVIDHLGGEPALLSWLDRHPGLPRLVATAYELIHLLDGISDRPSVVTALSDTRQQIGTPPELAAHLVPDTTGDTLASLAGRIESLLAEEEYGEAVAVTLATAELLQQVAVRAEPLDPSLAALSEQVDRIREKVREVAGVR
jgi:hypothetical protein